MIWADRVGAVLAILAFVFYATDTRMDPALVFGWLALAPWLAMRFLDFIFTGHVRGRQL